LRERNAAGSEGMAEARMVRRARRRLAGAMARRSVRRRRGG
jgi:hypothetical protein